MSQHEKDSVNEKGTESADKWPLKIDRLDGAKRQEILQIAERVTERNHELEMNCAERTFATIYDAFEKYTDLPRGIGRLTTAFGGGGGSTSYGLCGGVTGALMGIGLFWGRVDPMDFLRTVGLNSVEEAKQLFAATPGIKVVDDLAAGKYPMPKDCSGDDAVFVGRIRQDISCDNGLTFWCVSDNLRKGAATNAVQIAELLVSSDTTV